MKKPAQGAVALSRQGRESEVSSPVLSLRKALSAHYFVFFAAMGAYFPYMPAWMDARGFRGYQIGIVGALMPTMAVVAPPVIGVLADAFALRGALIWVSALGATLSMAALLFVTALSPELGFGVLFTCVLGFTMFRNPLVQLADVLALESRGDYGRLRLWGSIGFMVAAPLVGEFVALEPAWALPAVCAVALCGVTVVALTLPRRAELPPVPVLAETRRLLRERGFRLLLLVAAAGQAAHAAYDLCITLQLRALGASGSTVGMAWAVGTAAEVVVMAVSATLFKRARIATWLTLSLAAGALRWALLAVMTDIEWILLSQPLHGLTFGLRWVCCLNLVRSFAGPSTMATAQGLFLGAFSLGSAVAMVVWGAAFESYGGAEVFGAASVVALLAAVLTLRLRGATRAMLHPVRGDV